MTAKGKREVEVVPVLAGEIPPVPDGFAVGGFDHAGDPWQQGHRELKAAGVDDSGPRKTYALLRRLAWEGHLRGGGIENDRNRLAGFQQGRAEAADRVERLRATHAGPRLLTEAEGGIAAQDENIARLAPLVEAAGKWEGHSTAHLKREADAAKARMEVAADRLAPYKAARLPAPEGWERALFEAQKASAAAEAEFVEAQAVFDRIGKEAQELRARAFGAMRTSLANVTRDIGEKTKAVVEAGDVAFWSSFPNRAPDELIGLYRHAERVNGIMVRLGAGPDAGLALFYEACGPAVGIVQGKVGAGPSAPPMREAGQHPTAPPTAILGELY